MSTTVEQTLGLAVKHHQAGRLTEAEAMYRRVLAEEPENANALHLLGVLAHQSGNNARALELIQQAVAINPTAAEFLINMASVLTALSRPEEAMLAAKKAVELNSESAVAQFALGKMLVAAGQVEEGIGCFRRALAIRRNFPEGHFQLGCLLAEQGKFDHAVAAFGEAVRLKPDYTDAWSSLGTAWKDLGKLDDAAGAYREALRLNPDSAEDHNNLGNVLNGQGKTEEAIFEYREAIRLRPDVALVHYNLGIALGQQSKPDDAIAAYREALRINPDYAEAYNNLGLALLQRNELAEATKSFSNAIRLKPDFGEAHWGLSWALLLGGDYENGWREFEWRWESSAYQGTKRPFPQAQWDGGDLNGQRIILHAEQGLGDTIQFARYVPLVSARGGKVILECSASLVPLFRNMPGLEEIIPSGKRPPPFDVVCSLLSLPLKFGTKLATIPASIPYLRADPVHTEAWSRKLPADPIRRRIGLVWAGNPDNKNDRLRSIPLRYFAPLANVKNARFYSLQIGPAANKISNSPPGLELIDFTGDLHDFADTAAMVANLDLVISVDTSVAHLSGALAVPTWLLVPHAPDWRWMLDRDDSPWYPTMRLFRQSRPDDWGPVVGEVVRQLQK